MKTKLCKKCGLEKPLVEMVANKNSAGGYENRCKQCRNHNCEKWLFNNREYFKKKCLEYYHGKKILKDYPEKKCGHCGAQFKPNTKKHSFCSLKCNRKAIQNWSNPTFKKAQLSYKKRKYNSDGAYREKVLKKCKENRKINCDSINDTYIKKLFRWGKTTRLKEVPEFIIELKRKQLKLERYAKTANESARA